MNDDPASHVGCSFTERVPLLSLIALPQMRKTMDREPLGELANSIAARGLLHNVHVARYLSRDLALHHLSAIEEHVYEPIDPSVLGQGPPFDVIIAGHRRVMAHKSLWLFGCETCREESRYVSGVCWSTHTKTLFLKGDVPLIQAVIVINPDPDTALLDQLAENIAIPPPPAEAAMAYAAQFVRQQKKQGTKLSAAAFARTIGVSDTRIRDALAFARLPKSVRALSVLGAPDRTGQRHMVLPYQAAVVTSKLLSPMENGMPVFSDAHILRWVHMGMAKGLRAPDWPAYVEGILASRKQSALFTEAIDASHVEQLARRLEVTRMLQVLGRSTASLRRAQAVHTVAKLGVLAEREAERIKKLLDTLPSVDNDLREDLMFVQQETARVFERIHERLEDEITIKPVTRHAVKDVVERLRVAQSANIA